MSPNPMSLNIRATFDTTMSKYPTVDTTGIYAKFDWHGLCSSILNWFM